MKKIVASTLLVSLGLSLYAPTALAVDSAATQTDASFEAGGGDGPVIPTIPDNPNEPDPEPIKPVIPTPPIVDGVTLSYVPTISFGGNNKISVHETNYQAVTEKVELKNGKEYYAPHFVQIADASGADKKWSVSVKQTKNYENTDASSKLQNTRIRLVGNTLSSPTNSPLTDIQGVSKESGKNYAAIPTATESNVLTVMSTSENSQSTTGRIYASVFADNYKAQDYYTKAGEVTTLGATSSRYEGIQLNVPKNENLKAVQYSGELTWTLTAGPK